MTERGRVTILAGAGLSKDVGLPTSIELAENLKKALIEAAAQAADTESAQRDRALARLHLATYRFLNGGIRFQQGLLNGDPDLAVNIEQLAIAAEELQARAQNPLSPYTSGWHPRILELEREAQVNGTELMSSFVSFIYAQLERWLGLTDSHTDQLHYLRNLVEICGEDYGVDIFTLNYDLCVEKALEKFTTRKAVNGFTAEEGWRPDTLKGPAPVKLFKLHGSLDWVADKAYGLCSLQCPRHNSAENIEGDNVRPLLIFGTAHKLSPQEPFLSLAYAFSQTVLNTGLLAVVGYSFGDEYVNQIIKQGIEKNTKLRILVVSPNAERQLKTVPFLQGREPRVSFLNMGAEAALSKGHFLKAVREILQGASDEEPFKD